MVQLVGQSRQRVALARALSVSPRVLLLDEPFAAVDALTRAHLQEDLLQAWQTYRQTILFVTHSVEEALRLADRVVVLGPHLPLAGGGDAAELRVASNVSVTEDRCCLKLYCYRARHCC